MAYVDEKELDAAKKEAAESDGGTFTITLKEPVLYNGKEYTELTFDFDKLTGEDSLNIEAELMAMGQTVVVPALHGGYLARMAAKACTEPIGYDLIKGFPIKYFNRIRTFARNFLMAAE